LTESSIEHKYPYLSDRSCLCRIVLSINWLGKLSVICKELYWTSKQVLWTAPEITNV